MRTLDTTEVQERELHIQPQGIFTGIDASDLHALEAAGEWLETDDDMIIQDGCEQNYLYLVVSGKVEVFKYNTETQKKQVLAQLGENSCMGEIAFIRGDVASANVKSLRKTVLWRIDHTTLQQYISQYPGGGQLCLNLADILAQRVQEGNTRLVGVTQSLSAYFGSMARQNQQKDIEAPLAAGMADMEIPREIYDMFVCETLQYPEGSQVGDEHRAYVDNLIKNNQVDFISWLEEGQRGQKLKVILKFVPLDEHGNVITHEEEEEVEHQPQAADTPDAPAAKPAPKPAQRPRPRPQRGHIVSVPQVQARVKGHTAVIKEKPDRIWQAIHYGAYVLLPFVTALTVLKFLPLESRIGIAHNETYQSLPFSGLINHIIFQPSNPQKEGALGAEQTLEGGFDVPQAGYFKFGLRFDQPIQHAAEIHVKLYNYRTLDVVVDQSYTLEADQQEIFLTDAILQGDKYEFTIEAREWPGPPAQVLFNAQGKH